MKKKVIADDVEVKVAVAPRASREENVAHVTRQIKSARLAREADIHNVEENEAKLAREDKEVKDLKAAQNS